jgi:hypothetical protein
MVGQDVRRRAGAIPPSETRRPALENVRLFGSSMAGINRAYAI